MFLAFVHKNDEFGTWPLFVGWADITFSSLVTASNDLVRRQSWAPIALFGRWSKKFELSFRTLVSGQPPSLNCVFGTSDSEVALVTLGLSQIFDILFGASKSFVDVTEDTPWNFFRLVSLESACFLLDEKFWLSSLVPELSGGSKITNNVAVKFRIRCYSYKNTKGSKELENRCAVCLILEMLNVKNSSMTLRC